MLTKLTNKTAHTALVLLLIPMLAITIALGNSPEVKAQTEPTVLVTGYNGTSINYTLTQLEAMPNVTMYGGFYQPNQHIINSGLWAGVSLLYLCSQVGGITPTCNVTVTGQGTNNFTYDMVNSGSNLNTQYVTYNNMTGAVQNQTQPVTIILAYQVNGTALPSSSLPAPRLVIVGPEGLLIDGSGGRSVTQVNVTNTAPAPTPTPTASPTPTPNPTPAPTPTPTPTPSPSPTASPTPTPSPSATPTVPEFPATAITVIALLITMMGIMIYKRKSTLS
jgi:hypothetical protein